MNGIIYVCYPPSVSIRLTAFVLKSFAMASEFIEIDSRDLEVTRDWLVNNALDDDTGCFIPRGRVIHKSMQVCKPMLVKHDGLIVISFRFVKVPTITLLSVDEVHSFPQVFLSLLQRMSQ